MTEEVKKRGRQAKADEVVELVAESNPVPAEPAVAMTFAEVAAWNRANAHLLAPAIDLEKPKRPKSKRI